MNSKIKAIIFDIGGVLRLPKNQDNQSIHIFNSSKEVIRLSKLVDIKNKKKLQKILRIYDKSSKGKISKKETLQLFSEELNKSESIIEKIFYNLYKKEGIQNKILIQFAKNSKKNGYKLGIITDQWHLSKKASVYDYNYSFFNTVIVSCDDKAKKPSDKPYLLAIKKLKVKANESLFIDDRMRNLRPARKLGMKVILFKNNKQFFEDIKKFNL